MVEGGSTRSGESSALLCRYPTHASRLRQLRDEQWDMLVTNPRI